MSTIPDMFASVMAADKFDPLVKYHSTFAFSTAADVATPAQAKAFADILVTDFANKNKALPRPIIVAQSAGLGAKFIPIDEMLADGFPEGHICHLHYLFVMGPETEGDGLVNGITNRTGSRMIEVADTIRWWFRGMQERVYLTIER